MKAWDEKFNPPPHGEGEAAKQGLQSMMKAMGGKPALPKRTDTRN